MTEALIVRTEIQVAAPHATVFAFLTDPEKILRWMGTEANVEPHPGGIYLLNSAAGTLPAAIHRGDPGPPPGLQLRLGRERERAAGIEPDRDRPGRDGEGTLVRLTHSGLPDPKECANHEKGWLHYLGRLAVAAPGGDPGPDVPVKD